VQSAALPPLSILDGKYQIVRQLGAGGMGAVYEARHRGTGRRVAVKVIATGSLTKNPEVLGRFQREAMASGAIESQYIAQVLDTGVDPATGGPYTVMELLVGEDLQQAMARLGAIAPDLALRIAAQACLGLRKAHEAGVVHRDIKPANLFLAKREDGDIVVKLLDFGIAKVHQDPLAGAEGAGLTQTGAMLGSPIYMSPEQARGKKDLDHRTDIWSLGVVLYEALTGTTPHGHVETFGELILQICSAIPRHVQELAPWVPPQVAAIVHRALALDPAQRFASAVEMADAIGAQLPAGHALTAAMFVPMPERDRASAAPRLELTSGMRSPGPSFEGLQPPPVVATAAPADATMMGLTNTRPKPRSRTARAAWIVPVAVATAAVLGWGAWRMARSHGDAIRATAVLSPAPRAVPMAVESLTPLPAERPAPDRTVRVVVLPPNAQAEVDGVGVPVHGGVVAVTGPLGSIHHVRLSAGRRQGSADVAIGEDGPLPPKVEIDSAPSKDAIANAPAAATAARPTTAPAPPPAPPPPASTSTGGLHMELK
jgi:serine/threonine-protein kinase